MTKQEMINEIQKMRIPSCFILITFKGKNNLYFQYFGNCNFSKFVNYNFKYYRINKVEKIERSAINSNCVIVYVK